MVNILLHYKKTHNNISNRVILNKVLILMLKSVIYYHENDFIIMILNKLQLKLLLSY